ncbi:putative transcriptional regulatory protein C56F2.05c [Rhypophila decipiens]
MTAHSPVDAMSGGSLSPQTTTAPPPKHVSFELLFPEAPEYRARIPLRVFIYQHDATDSIATTVKNFYGLYSGPSLSKGISFEDDKGNTLIARYENFHNNMTVYVRVIDDMFRPTGAGSHGFGGHDAYQAYAPVSRPASRTSRVRSPSPNSGRGRRSDSAGTSATGGKKGRSRSSKTRGEHTESLNGYSSGDGAPGSASGKPRDLGNTEISLENIVEGGRRKRAKFESSELPLFAPPQMPAAASNSSVSPARRADHHRQSLPFVQPGQNPFSNPRPLQSPQCYNNGYANTYATPGHDERRARGSFSYGAVGPGMAMMPTPDPTVGSCMSEEDKDVAIQLMRLGEMSNSAHGRTSASTLDDTFSGKADAASSTGATSDAESEEDELPARRQKLDHTKKSFQTTQARFVGPKERADAEASGDDADYEDGVEEGSMAAPKLKNPKSKSSSTTQRPRSQSSNKSKSTTTKQSKPKTKKAPAAAGPMTPASLPASRKQSVASNPPPPTFPLAPAEDEQPDLSTKPRCQRCRKSKKGCDRQRPCGRCRDAGLSADMCISEDEGNGRKGRFGRHMGVPLKNVTDPATATNLLPAAPIATLVPGPSAVAGAPATAGELDLASGGDKNKKRKR